MNANMMPMSSGMNMQMDMQGEAALPMEMPQGTTMQGGSGHAMDHGADHGTGMQMLGPDGKPMQMNP
jgi:hypothetical protein